MAVAFSAVVEPAEQLRILDGRWAASGERIDMIDLAPHRGQPAPRMLTHPVTNLDRFTKRTGEESFLRPEIKDLAVVVEDDPSNMTLKSQPNNLPGRDGHTGVGFAHTLGGIRPGQTGKLVHRRSEGGVVDVHIYTRK